MKYFLLGLFGVCTALAVLFTGSCERMFEKVDLEQPQPIRYTIEQIVPDSLFVVRVIGKDGNHRLSVSSALAAGLRELSRTYTLKAESIKTLQDRDGSGSPYTEGVFVSVAPKEVKK